MLAWLPLGGRLPDPVRHDVLAALRAGLHLASGLHTRLADDPELAAACWPDRWIWDLRREPEALNVGQARAAALPCQRLLAVGTDMAVGKMSACLSLLEAAQRSGIPARFVGQGQAGILISGEGVALDAVRVDYAAGAVEAAVLRAAADALPEQGLVLVEGQGSLCHPASTATLPLLRGTQPTALLLVHRAGQQTIDRLPQIPLPDLEALVATTEALASWARPDGAGASAKVAAVALNTARLDEDQARRSRLIALSQTLGLALHRSHSLGCRTSAQSLHEFLKGRARGFEPPNSGATSRCLNHLATPAASVRIYQHELQPAWCPLHRVRNVCLLWRC